MTKSVPVIMIEKKKTGFWFFIKAVRERSRQITLTERIAPGCKAIPGSVR